MNETWHLYEEEDYTPEEFDVITEADSCYCLRPMQDFCMCSRDAKKQFTEFEKRIDAHAYTGETEMPLASMLELMRTGKDFSKGVNKWQA